MTMTSHMTHASQNLHLYDTASHSITKFVPLQEGRVGIYVCGATVQSSPHVGHLRAGVAFDVIRRWLMRLGFDVTFIRNVTDIDDKILDKSAAVGQQWWQRAYIYEQEFTRAYQLLGVLTPTYEPRATGHIPEIVALIERLIERGHAYPETDSEGNLTGSVYFDVPSWPQYGELTHQESGTQSADADEHVEAMAPSIDKAGDDKYNPADSADLSETKRNPRDFALWKASKPSDPHTARWNTPYGLGRPGWHIECSAMSQKYLGDTFDIHGGGLDLRFPHHENEVAQSRAAGWNFAQRWLHSAWVTQKGEKMSKSLGNGLSVEAVLEGYTPWMVRYALATVHYRSMLEWSDQTLEEARSAWERITGFLNRASAVIEMPSHADIAAINADSLPESFVTSMNDDINISGALATIFSTLRQGNSALALVNAPAHGDFEAEQALETVSRTVREVRAMLDAFGLDPFDPQWASVAGRNAGLSPDSGLNDSAQNNSPEREALESLIAAQLTARSEARTHKDFAHADAIRDSLSAAGITIEDGPQGSTWKFARA